MVKQSGTWEKKNLREALLNLDLTVNKGQLNSDLPIQKTVF
jgi:hypothetical protein